MTSHGVREFDYFVCCVEGGEWESDSEADFGEKMPYEFDTLDELKADMKRALLAYLSKK